MWLKLFTLTTLIGLFKVLYYYENLIVTPMGLLTDSCLQAMVKFGNRSNLQFSTINVVFKA